MTGTETGIDETTALALAAEPEPRPVGSGRLRWLPWVLRRLAFGLLTLLLLSMLVFFATHVLPGNAARAVLGSHATPAQLQATEQELGLDHPVTQQYWAWLTNTVSGDLGNSLVSKQSVASQIGAPLGNTLILLVLVMLISVPLALFLGVLAATRQDGRLDASISAASIGLAALPEFVIGIGLITLFSTQVLKLFPAVVVVPAGGSPLSQPDSMVLPVATLTLAVVPYLLRLVRGSMIDTLHADYVTMARLKGLRGRTILIRHVLRNALVPAIQGTALALAYLLGGVVTIEYLFAYPGLGALLINAANERDIPVIEAISLIFAAGYILFNLVADMLTIYVTPRLRTR